MPFFRMPFLGFIFVLLVVGGLASLIAIGDPINSRGASYVGFTLFFAGLGSLSLSIILGLIGWQLLGSDTLLSLGFAGGYFLGGIGGAAFGFHRAVRRRRRIDAEARET
jgi:hypothetical protein